MPNNDRYAFGNEAGSLVYCIVRERGDYCIVRTRIVFYALSWVAALAWIAPGEVFIDGEVEG
jgi:hypothetical protein